MPSDPASVTPGDQHRKRRAFVFLAGALALLFLLSIGITGLPLLPGEPFSLNLTPTGQPNGAKWAGSDLIVLFVRVMLALALVLFPINLILVILTKEGRRRLLINLVTIVALWLWLPTLSRIARNLLNLAEEQQSSEGGAGSPNAPSQLPPLPDFTPNPSDLTVIAVALAIALLLVGLASAIVWLIWRRRGRQNRPLERLGEQAQAALEALQSGGDFKSTIIRCYRDMSRVLQQERGIQRGIAMTSSEFELALQGKGLPRDAIHQLTHVFEDVRYGGQAASEREERLAIDSLSAIVAACKSA
jgi:hypothetical protein